MTLVTAMTASKILKKSAYLLSAFLLAACQPTPSNDASVTVDNGDLVDKSLVITADSVTMASDYILSIKPSRYQPSVGLQGTIEPVKQINLVAAHPVNIEEVLVTEGQLVEKGMPLLIVRRLSEGATTDNAVQNLDEAKQEADANSNPQSDVSTTAGNTATIENRSDASELTDNREVSVDELNTSANNETAENEVGAEPQYNLTTVRASFTGRIEGLEIKAGQKLAARTPLLQLNDETQLYFVATLPIQAEPQLSIGQTVNFTAEGKSDNFTGQVSKLTKASQPKRLLVYVDVIENKASRANLAPDMQATGRVDYGQIDVGTIVPEHALHDVDLTELQMPPYKPLRPLTANVWIIGQDQRLVRRPIEVVEYNPTTKQYLIAGISNDSLICLADLPIDSKGKRVIVS